MRKVNYPRSPNWQWSSWDLNTGLTDSRTLDQKKNKKRRGNGNSNCGNLSGGIEYVLWDE